jgi:hypothetical protein
MRPRIETVFNFIFTCLNLLIPASKVVLAHKCCGGIQIVRRDLGDDYLSYDHAVSFTRRYRCFLRERRRRRRKLTRKVPFLERQLSCSKLSVSLLPSIEPFRHPACDRIVRLVSGLD